MIAVKSKIHSEIIDWPLATRDDFLEGFKSYFSSDEIEFTRINYIYLGRNRFSVPIVVGFSDEQDELKKIHFRQIIKVERNVVLKRFLQSLCTTNIDNYIIVNRRREFEDKELKFTIQKCVENNLLQPTFNVLRGYPRSEYKNMQNLVESDSIHFIEATDNVSQIKFYYERPPDRKIFPRGPFYENCSYYNSYNYNC